MKHILAALAIALPVLAGCRQGEAASATKDFTFQGDEVTVRPDSPVARELKVEPVGASAYESAFRTVGTVRPMAGRVAEVAVPFAGRITRTMVRLGDYVRAGQPLFEMSSPDFYAAVKEYFENQLADKNASANLKRREAMHQAGILSEREFEEARAEAENARNAYQMSKMALSFYHVDLDRLQVGQPITVTAPITGRVVACDLTPGQYVKEDADPLSTIAELSRVWVSAQVKEADLGRIELGRTHAQVIRDNAPEAPIAGQIVYVGEILDEQTRSTDVVLECDNAQHLLRPGMFVSVDFTTPRSQALLVPSTAVFQGEGGKYVYVETGPMHFGRRPVRVESAGTDRVCVVAGLSEGERIVTSGGIYLNE